MVIQKCPKCESHDLCEAARCPGDGTDEFWIICKSCKWEGFLYEKGHLVVDEYATRKAATVTMSGLPATPGVPGAPQPIDPETGMHKDYWILSDEERAKGFVRPVRTKYVHAKCGAVTRMNQKISETYARDPKFYGATFCCNCGEHFPVKEFWWDDDNHELVGS